MIAILIVEESWNSDKNDRQHVSRFVYKASLITSKGQSKLRDFHSLTANRGAWIGRLALINKLEADGMRLITTEKEETDNHTTYLHFFQTNEDSEKISLSG